MSVKEMPEGEMIARALLLQALLDHYGAMPDLDEQVGAVCAPLFNEIVRRNQEYVGRSGPYTGPAPDLRREAMAWLEEKEEEG